MECDMNTCLFFLFNYQQQLNIKQQWSTLICYMVTADSPPPKKNFSDYNLVILNW